MIVRCLVVPVLLAGLALGVAAPVASAASTAPQSAECDHIKQRYDLVVDRIMKHLRVHGELTAQAQRASGADRRTLEHRASTHLRLADVYDPWWRARHDQLETRCGYSFEVHGVALRAVPGASAPAQPTSPECEHIAQRFDHNLDRMGKHQRVARQLRGEAQQASGAARRTLEHRASTHGRLEKQYAGWMSSRARQLVERCGQAFGSRDATTTAR